MSATKTTLTTLAAAAALAFGGLAIAQSSGSSSGSTRRARAVAAAVRRRRPAARRRAPTPMTVDQHDGRLRFERHPRRFEQCHGQQRHQHPATFDQFSSSSSSPSSSGTSMGASGSSSSSTPSSSPSTPSSAPSTSSSSSSSPSAPAASSGSSDTSSSSGSTMGSSGSTGSQHHGQRHRRVARPAPTATEPACSGEGWAARPPFLFRFACRTFRAKSSAANGARKGLRRTSRALLLALGLALAAGWLGWPGRSGRGAGTAAASVAGAAGIAGRVAPTQPGGGRAVRCRRRAPARRNSGWAGRAPGPHRSAARRSFQDQHPPDEVRQVADWAVDSGDHGARAFAIVDKKNARVWLFDARRRAGATDAGAAGRCGRRRSGAGHRREAACRGAARRKRPRRPVASWPSRASTATARTSCGSPMTWPSPCTGCARWSRPSAACSGWHRPRATRQPHLLRLHQPAGGLLREGVLAAGAKQAARSSTCSPRPAPRASSSAPTTCPVSPWPQPATPAA